VKRLLRSVWAVLSSRATSPLVIGFFLLIYIGIAFVTDETLITLMEFTRRSVFLAVPLALLPLSSVFRLLKETGVYLKRRRVLAGSILDVSQDYFDEMVELSAPLPFAELQSRLAAGGYKTHHTGNVLAAWRGISIFPARMIYLAGTFCLFAGILISLTTRGSHRVTLIEGEPIPVSAGGGRVDRIVLEESSGSILARKLSMEVIPPNSANGKKVFGLYPPALYRGEFVYPRYLGIGLFARFSAPDLQTGYEKHCILNIHPPGKEDSIEIPGSSYRIVFSLAKPDDGSDPYVTGRMTFLFKLLKGKDVIVKGRAPSGGEFVQDGYRLAFPDSRRLVVTDFIRDYGVFLLWTAGMLFLVAGCIWLPVRFFVPRREMLFRSDRDAIHAFSRAEGGARRHVGVFHEALDILEAKRPSRT
jgi:hypothetical protein